MLSIGLKPREKIISEMEKEMKKRFFDKAQKSYIIHNDSSLFLKRVMSFKSRDSKKIKSNNYHSMSFNHSYDLNNINIYYNNETNKTPIFKKKNLLIDFKKNIYHHNKNINYDSQKDISCKIYVNKNRNLGNSVKKERQKTKDGANISNNNNNKIKKKNIEKKLNAKKKSQLLNTTDSTELSCSSLYNNKLVRKPIVIRFENILNTSYCSINKDKQIQDENEEKQKQKQKKRGRERAKSDLRIKPEIFFETIEKKRKKSELFRNFKDLEEKSFEINKRKMKKNLSFGTLDFKKVNNLSNVRQSFDKIRQSKSKNKDKNQKKEKNDRRNERNNGFFNLLNFKLLNNKNRFIKQKKIIKNFSLKDFNNNKKENIYLQEQKKIENNNKNKYYNNKILNTNSFVHIKSIYNIKNKNENSFNIEKDRTRIINNKCLNNVNRNNIKGIYLNKRIDLNNSKTNYFLNINKKNIKNKNRYSGNKTPVLRKRFIEDNNIFDKRKTLSSNNSFSNLTSNNNNTNDKHIKVNRIKNSKTKSKHKIKKVLPSILEEEEKVKFCKTKKTYLNPNIFNAITKIEILLKNKYMNHIKEKLKILNTDNEQTDTCSHKFQNSLSQISGLKYIKKIIPKEKNEVNKKFYFRGKNFFNMEKNKTILLKRKNLRDFEKFEKYKDLIENFRLKLIAFFLINNEAIYYE